VIPPAWREVWIAPTEDGHLQVTGIDTKNRKQYIYHPLWNAIRNKAKFAHMHEFGTALPSLRHRLQEDLKREGLQAEKILAAAVAVIQATCIRVGSNLYEQLYGSYGLTTLKKKHVAIEGSTVKFTFRGKKGVHHDLTAQDEQLAEILKQCKAIPGSNLLQYYDENGRRRKLDSAMVNNYIKQISGGYFTAKDFRTWTGTLHAIESLKQLGPATTQTAAKRNVVAALDMVATRLGNTRSVCKKYYVHPVVIDHYTNNTLERFFKKAPVECKNGLSPAEQILLSMLQKH
jgi:DNA topoisomerase-1